MIISNNVTEVGLGLENKIIQINLSQKKCFVKKKKEMKRISMTDCILTPRLQENKWFCFLRNKIMLNPPHNGAVQKVQATREERLVLTVR